MRTTQSRRTPIDDLYPSCAEVRAGLLIYTPRNSPHEVTLRLGLEPSVVVVKGKEVQTSTGRVRIPKNSFWKLSSDGHVESLDLRRHIDWLLERLCPRREALKAVQDFDGVVMSINCAWYSRAGNGGPTLWPEQMQAMAELNLECSFDIYFMPDDE